MFMQYFYFHYLLQYYHYSLPPYPEDTILILYQFLSVALYHFTSVANTVLLVFHISDNYLQLRYRLTYKTDIRLVMLFQKLIKR
ncbi:MAG: hypothetical protein LN546_04250, partial [Rickettsia endosymbiont of Ecitomorpha arachnoides]|nr:hypothetical protein [Rickettsia endosymbiont of Ecitomorpha arachnoides]